MSTTKPFPILYEFSVSLPKEVDQTNTHVEGEGVGAKTVTETTKVTKSVNVPVCLKRPSRIEREEADVERAVWETHYVTKGILPQALLLKTYANYGGILSEDEKARFNKMQADILLIETELQRLQVTTPDDKAAIEAAALKLVDLRDQFLTFQQERAAFFSNTAESKARQKLIEWYVLHLAYQRTVNADETLGEWVPIFAGRDTESKLLSFDAIVENEDPLFAKARNMLEFLATVLASNDNSVSKEEVEAYAETLKDQGQV